VGGSLRGLSAPEHKSTSAQFIWGAQPALHSSNCDATFSPFFFFFFQMQFGYDISIQDKNILNPREIATLVLAQVERDKIANF